MAWTRRYDGPEPQRVNKWLAQSGVCSRREAEEYIARGLVSIDGECVRDPGRKIEAGQTLSLAARAEAGLPAALSVIIHKPVGFVSAQPEPGQVPAARLLTRQNLIGAGDAPPADAKLPPLGRLDQDSRGLLLLSQDGVLAKAVIGPDSTMEKEYLVGFDGRLTPKKLALLRHGLELDGRQLKPAIVEDLGDQRLRFVLREGRNRQIRRMAELVDLWVVDLLRVRIGRLTLGDLPEGCWRHLGDADKSLLLAK
jgi:23S rRNA pseudouridine2604 synthase